MMGDQGEHVIHYVPSPSSLPLPLSPPTHRSARKINGDRLASNLKWNVPWRFQRKCATDKIELTNQKKKPRWAEKINNATQFQKYFL